MGLFPCPECGKQISDEAQACPQCGWVVKREKLYETERAKQEAALEAAIHKDKGTERRLLGCVAYLAVTLIISWIAGAAQCNNSAVTQTTPVKVTPEQSTPSQSAPTPSTSASPAPTASLKMKLLSLPTDSDAKYYLLERGGTSGRPIITTMRVGPSGTSYSRREYDCANGTWRYLGDGETLEEMNASSPDSKMSPLESGSIADYLGRVACAAK